jgi:hypothetical protein
MLPGLNKNFFAGLSPIIPGTPPTLEAIGIVPRAIASRKTKPNDSYLDGNTHNSADL